MIRVLKTKNGNKIKATKQNLLSLQLILQLTAYHLRCLKQKFQPITIATTIKFNYFLRPKTKKHKKRKKKKKIKTNNNKTLIENSK